MAPWHTGDRLWVCSPEMVGDLLLNNQKEGVRGLASNKTCKLKPLKLGIASEMMKMRIFISAICSHFRWRNLQYIHRQAVSPPSPWLLPAGGCCYVFALCSPVAQLWTNPCWLCRDHMASSLWPAPRGRCLCRILIWSAQVSCSFSCCLPLPSASPKKGGGGKAWAG